MTGADLNYEGSISIDPKLCEAADLVPYERVDILDVNNGQRFSTYVIHGKAGEICLNGAAARLVQKGDLIIIVAFGNYEETERKNFKPRKVFVDANNAITSIHGLPEGAQ